MITHFGLGSQSVDSVVKMPLSGIFLGYGGGASFVPGWIVSGHKRPTEAGHVYCQLTCHSQYAARKKKCEQRAPAQAPRRTGRASRLTEMIRASQQSLTSTSSETVETEIASRGALSTVIQALAKVW